MISIIVPIYNVEKFLHQCIDSILSQTYKDYEIILVDDGATDNCPKICDDYSAKNHKVKVIHKPNGGLVSAWMEGIKASTGEYICFIDSDDFVGNEYLSKLYSALIDSNSDVAAMNCTRFIDENNMYQWRINTLDQGTYELADYRDRIICDYGSFNKIISNSRWAKLIKSDLVKKAMQSCDKAISYGEDQQLTLGVLMLAKRIVILKEFDYFYRKNLNSIVNTYKKDSWKKIKRLMNVLSNIPNIQEIDNYQKQCNSMLILYANDVIKEELFHKKANVNQNIRDILSDDQLNAAWQNYYSENMLRIDRLMSRAVKSKSLFHIKSVMTIYKLYCKLKGGQ